MSADPRGLGPEIARLAELSEAAGHPRPEVAVLGGLPPGAGQDGADLLAALAEIGVTRFVAGGRYTTAREFRTLIEGLNQARPRTD